MRRKPRHILSYWRPAVAREMFENYLLLQDLVPIGKTIIKPGDTVWVCTRLQRSGKLFLLGRLIVGEHVLEGWTRKLIAKDKTVEPLRAVSLMDVYQDIRFNTKNYSDRLILRHGRINPEQFGSSRILTDETIDLFNSIWYDDKAVEEFDEVLEKDILYAAQAETGYADPITNKEVEEKAVSLLKSWYQAHGWKVVSVESENRGYDLVCSKGKQEEHVEVKGTNGFIPSFFITTNEYECALEDPCFVLCVITEVFSSNPLIYRYVGNQILDEFEFTIRQYKAVPRNF